MSKDVISFMNDALSRGTAVALAVLTESGRDTPGIPGGMMAVCAEGSRMGTIGGGAAEARVIEDCNKALQGGSADTFPFDYSLRAEGGLGMVCGGDMRGFVTIVRPARRLFVFGGGHVGQKVYEAGLVAGFDVTVVEDREEYAGLFPKAKTIITESLGAAAQELPIGPESYVVIATRGHAHDYAVLENILGRGATYVGMIGSRKKVAGLFAKLREQGTPEEELARIYSPVGLCIDNGTPGEIAIAILAEILALKNKAVPHHCRETI